nr:MAG TPA: hypothetical protein [Caudoviricetes sp.]
MYVSYIYRPVLRLMYRIHIRTYIILYYIRDVNRISH